MKKTTPNKYIHKLFVALLAFCMAICIWSITASAEDSAAETEHEWTEADCTAPKTCNTCGETEGDPDPENHLSVDIESGLCTCGYQFEARIGDKPYPGFAEAFSAAGKGDTVVAYTGKSDGLLTIPEGVIFDGGEQEFSAMTENRGEIIGGKYTGSVTSYGKILGGLFEGSRFALGNYGDISGGTFNIYVEHYSGKLTGGTFNVFVAAHADIDGGHFTESGGIDFYADMDTGAFYVVVNGGVFDCDLTAFTNIYGGVFNGKVINCSEIFGGVFNGEVINSRGKIFDGEFNGKVTNGVLAENGVLDRNGFILGGSFNSEILNYSHINNLNNDDYTFKFGDGFLMTDVNGRITCEEHIKASDATCVTQAVCHICGGYGDLLDHTWLDADCDTPMTCEACGATDGEALGHTWTDADCDTPKTCNTCGATDGEALGHDFLDATTESPKTCKTCGRTEGERLPTVDDSKENGTSVGEGDGTPDKAERNVFAKILDAVLTFFRGLIDAVKSFFRANNVN